MSERPLTSLELATFVLMTHGYSDADTAAVIGSNEANVRQTLKRVSRKLGAGNRGHATRLGFQRGILERCPEECEACKNAPSRKTGRPGRR